MRRCAVVLFSVFVSLPATALAADTGRVAFLSGPLEINGKTAKTGDAVNEGDNLQSGAGATADIVMASGVRFRLYPNTKVSIPGESRKNPIKLVIGRLLSIVKPGRPFSVAGRTAVAGVRGTTFYVDSQPDKRTYVCICKGKLKLSTAEGKDAGEIESQNHLAVALDNDAKTDEPMIGHTDDDIAALAGR